MPVDVEAQPVRHAERGARHREGGRQARLEPGGEGRGVLVLDLAHLAADRSGAVPDDRTQRQRPLGDLDRHVAAGHRRDRAAQVLALVDDVGADVAERARAHAALEPPAQRAARVAGVVAPVAGVEGGQLAQLAVADVVADRGDGRGPAIAVADGGDGLAGLLQLDHRPGVLHRPRQRLLAQHVLAGGDQCLGDRPVQRVADHDAHRVDRRVLGDGLPARQRLLVAVPARAVLGERDVGVGDRGQPDRREPRPEDRAGHPVRRSVAAARHPGADDCDGDLLRHVLTLHSSLRCCSG